MMNPIFLFQDLIDLSFCVEMLNMSINIKSVANSIFVRNVVKRFASVSCKT